MFYISYWNLLPVVKNPQEVNCALGINNQFCLRATFRIVSYHEMDSFLNKIQHDFPEITIEIQNPGSFAKPIVCNWY